MNAIEHPNIFMRSLATRDTGSEISAALPEVIAACKLAGFDLIIVETSGIGQGNAAIVPFVDVSLYVMTPEFGAASQLEKIDMLDFADFVAINKFDRKGAEDALRDVRKQYQRNRELFATPTDDMPVFGTMAARFNDDGVTALYQALVPHSERQGSQAQAWQAAAGYRQAVLDSAAPSYRPHRVRYLAEIADAVRGYHAHIEEQVGIARERQSLRIAKDIFAACDKSTADFDELVAWKDGQQDPKARKLLDMWPDTVKAYSGDEYVVKIRDKEIRTRLTSESLSGTRIRKVILPKFTDDGEIAALPDEGERPRFISLHRRRFRLQARERRPDPHVRRRRRCLPHQPPLQARFRRHAGQAPVHRLRLRHAVRLRPRRAPGHLRQDRQLRRLDRHARRPARCSTTASTCSPRQHRSR